MRQMIFVGSKGRFPVPAGESQLGSDSSCGICIQGDGVLPNHAYLKLDGERLLIRPSSEKATLQVDGLPVTGPQNLAAGQRIQIGQIELRLQANRPPLGFWALLRGLWGSRWLRWPLYGGAVLALILVGLRYLYFNDEWWKRQVSEWVEKNLYRDEIRIGFLEADPLQGRLVLRGLEIPNREERFGDNLLTIREVHLELDSWAYLKSGFQDLRASLQLQQPILFLSRRNIQGRPVSNVSDIWEKLLKRYRDGEWRSLGLSAFEGRLSVEGGQILLQDKYVDLPGESRLTDLRLELRQPGLDEQLSFQLEARTGVGPDQPEAGQEAPGGPPAPQAGHKDPGPQGRFTLRGHFDWFGGGSQAGSEEGGLAVELTEVDLARLSRHLQWDYPIYVEKGKVAKLVPGKPVTGNFTMVFNPAGQIRVAGYASSESLVSLVERGRPPIGNIPTFLEIRKLDYDLRKRQARSIDVQLISKSPPGTQPQGSRKTILDLQISGQLNPSGGYTFRTEFEAPLEDFAATDVGERLGLKDRLRGRLTAGARFTRDTEGETSFKADAQLDETAQVNVGGVWQPLRFGTELIATVRQNAEKEWTGLDVRKLEVHAGAQDSFTASSIAPYHVWVMDDHGELTARASFKLHIRGKEFWAEFAPLLGLLGFQKPVEEIFDMEVKVVSDQDRTSQPGRPRLELTFVGTARRQWKHEYETEPDPKPIQLKALLDYYPSVFTAPAPGKGIPAPPAPDEPYALELTLQLGSQDTPIFVNADKIRFYFQDRLWRQISSSDLAIKSDLAALQERLDPYLTRLESFLGTHWYKSYRVDGILNQSGALKLTRSDPARSQLEAEFKFQLEGENLALEGPLPFKPSRAWYWKEPHPQMSFKGRYLARKSTSEEDPDIRLLHLDEWAVRQGKLGKFSASLHGLDLWLLENLSLGLKLPGKHWVDCVQGFTLQGELLPDAFDLLRRLEQLPQVPAFSGQLKLDIKYDRKKDLLNLDKLVFTDTQASWLKDLRLAAQIRDLRNLSKRLGSRVPFLLYGQHIGEQLAIKSLQIDTEAFLEWVKTFPQQARYLPLPEPLAERIQNGLWAPQKDWIATDCELVADPERERTWTLVGRFQTDFQATLPPLGSAPRTTLRFQGPWSIRKEAHTALSFSDDFSMLGLGFEANFDQAGLTLQDETGLCLYEKKASQPLALELKNASLVPGTSGKETQVECASTALLGGPFPLRLSGAAAQFQHPDEPDQPFRLNALRLEEADLGGGPFPCKLKKAAYDQKTGRASFRLDAPLVDLARLQSLGLPAGSLLLSGQLANLAILYDGQWRTLSAGALVPGEDELKASADLGDPKTPGAGVTIQGILGPREQITVNLNGQASLTASELSLRDLELSVGHLSPQSSGISVTRFSAPTFYARAGDPKQNLRQAILNDPPNCLLKLPLKTDGLFDPRILWQAGRIFHKILFQTGQTPTAAEIPFNATLLKGIQLAETSLRASDLVLGQQHLTDAEIPVLAWDGARLQLPSVKGGFLGGRLELTDLEIDCSQPKAQVRLGATLRQLPLANLLASNRPHPGTYALEGSLDLAGRCSGSGLSLADLPAWSGQFAGQLSGLKITPPTQPAPPLAGPAWTTPLHPLIRSALAAWGGQGSVEAIRWWQAAWAGQPPNPGGPADCLLLALQTYLARLGLDTHTCQLKSKGDLSLSLKDGSATLRGRFSGEGESAGLELACKGLLRLADLTSDEPLALWAAKLPPGAQRNLHLKAWPQALAEQFQEELAEGRLALRLSGPLARPTLELPQKQLAHYLRLAVFGLPLFLKPEDLLQGLKALETNWGQTPEARREVVELLSRGGLALPGTLSARWYGRHLLEGVQPLPPEFVALLERLQSQPAGQFSAPDEVLQMLLHPAPPTPPAPPAPPGQRPGPPAERTEKPKGHSRGKEENGRRRTEG